MFRFPVPLETKTRKLGGCFKLCVNLYICCKWLGYNKCFREFGETNNKAVNEPWYRAAVLQHYINDEDFVFSVPFESGKCIKTLIFLKRDALFNQEMFPWLKGFKKILVQNNLLNVSNSKHL